MCHRHGSDHIYTHARNNFNLLLHNSDVFGAKYAAPSGQEEKAQPAQDVGEQKGLTPVFFKTHK